MYLTLRLDRAGFEILSPGGDHRSGETLVRLQEPSRACAFLLERAIHVEAAVEQTDLGSGRVIGHRQRPSGRTAGENALQRASLHAALR